MKTYINLYVYRGEESAKLEPLAPLMKPCFGLSGHLRRRNISAEIAERTLQVFHLLTTFVLFV